MTRGLLVVALVACGRTPDGPAPRTDATPAEAPLPAPRAGPGTPTPSPLATPGDADVVRVRAHLDAVVRRHGLDRGNPWALGHAIVALGADATLPDGQSAVDALVARWGRPVPLPGGAGVVFPTRDGDVRVEPHRDLILKTLVDVGVAPERPLSVAGEPRTAADLWRGSLSRTWFDGGVHSAASYNDLAWTLFGLSGWAPKGLSWTAEGHASTLDALTHAVVQRLQADTAFLAEARAAGAPLLKRGQGIFAYTCGGAHFLQGAAQAVAHGFGAPEDADALRGQAALAVWRFEGELTVTDEALEAHPEHRLILLVQRLKFVGHHLETMHRLAALGLVPPDDALPAHLQRVRIELVRTVDTLRAEGAWDRMPEIRAQREQTWLDLIGDAAHALRGLDLSTGTGVVWR